MVTRILTARSAWIILVALGSLAPAVQAAPPAGSSVDASEDFRDPASVHFIPAAVKSLDGKTGRGRLKWNRYQRSSNLSFNKIDVAYARAEANEFPASEYDRDPTLPFSISFVSPRTVRLRFATRPDGQVGNAGDERSLMLASAVPTDAAWVAEEAAEGWTFRSAAAQVHVRRDPWQIRICDAKGRLVTRTRILDDPKTYSTPTPF